MLLGDKNMQLIVSNRHILVVRASSVVMYNTETYESKILDNKLNFVKAFSGKIYDYSRNKINSYELDTKSGNGNLKAISSKEFKVEEITDFYKCGKNFYFIKQFGKSRLCVFSQNLEAKSILDFKSPYSFDSFFLFAIVDNMIIRVGLNDCSKKIIQEFQNKPAMMACKYLHAENQTIVAYTDVSNKLHIFDGSNYRLYHWLTKGAEDIKIYEEFIIVASKDGKIVKFHTKLQKSQLMFEFMGIFVDMEIVDSHIYMLSDIQLQIYDLKSENVIFNDFLIPLTEITAFYCKMPNEEKSDVFKLKKQSKIQIKNSIPNLSEDLADQMVLAFVKEKLIFILNPQTNKICSQFTLPSDNNFISYGKVLSFTHRKSNILVNTYDIYRDFLVLVENTSISSKDKHKFLNAYYCDNKIYFLTKNGLYLIGLLGITETIAENITEGRIKSFHNKLYFIDEKGIYDVSSRNHIVKQKKIQIFAIIEDTIIFCIENRGLYADMPDRKCLFEVTNLIDLKIHKKKEQDLLAVLYIDQGRSILKTFYFDKKEGLILEKETSIASNYSKVILETHFSTKCKQLATN